MFSKKKRAHSAEVEEAMRTRDELIDQVESAVAKVDRLHAELIDAYRVAEEKLREKRWS